MRWLSVNFENHTLECVLNVLDLQTCNRLNAEKLCPNIAMQVKTRIILWTLANNTVCVRATQHVPELPLNFIDLWISFRSFFPRIYLWHLSNYSHEIYVYRQLPKGCMEFIHFNAVWNQMFFINAFTIEHQQQMVIHTGSGFVFSLSLLERRW